MYSIEIPRAGEERVVVYRQVQGQYELADDFVYDSESYVISSVRARGERLHYLGPDDGVVFDRPLRHLRPS